jgi:hypothetical protein
MKTTDAINFFADKDFTDDQGYNILIEDLWSILVFEDKQEEVSHVITEADMERPEVQAVIGFFMYQIQQVLFPAIRVARFDAAEGSPGIVK